MNDIFFDDFKNIIRKEFLKSEQKIEIAVAWINFKLFQDIFLEVLKRNVELDVIVNSDFINSKHPKIVDNLKESGMRVHLFEMPGKKQYMHNKFCVIDGKIALSGSYNWTENATNNNMENLMMTSDALIIRKLRDEFNNLKLMSLEDLKRLKHVDRCGKCKSQISYICILDEIDYETELKIYELCQCGENEVFCDYYHLSVYKNLISIGDQYSDVSDWEELSLVEREQLDATFEHQIQTYLGKVAKKIEHPIHAIGVKTISRNKYFDEGDIIIRVLWKNRFVSKFVEDEYYDF